MKPGTPVTVISPLPMKNHKGHAKFSAKEGVFLSREKDGTRVVEFADKSRLHLEKGSGSRLTTKYVDISPCGLLE